MRVAWKSESQNFKSGMDTQSSNKNPTLSRQRMRAKTTGGWGEDPNFFLSVSLGFVFEAAPVADLHCYGDDVGGSADT